ncbi:MAG: site-2 protease family protein [Pseudonocardia sp.]|nr:site-2 protease family protein [Pseudonocardia sp.]
MLMTVLGIVIFFAGILISIAWHELGHFVTARWFGIKVPEFFVGFGKTVWSRKVGETEYGIKAIPMGGYVRMIGMIPPAKGSGNLGRSRRTGPFQGLMDDARQQSAMDVLPEDADRQFWMRSPWKRIVVMFGGPFMNLILAIGLFAVVLMGIGVQQEGTQVGSVSACVLPASAPVDAGCAPGAAPTPAAEAGFRAGDRIVALNGQSFGPNDGRALREAIRVASGPTLVTVERDGQRLDLPTTVIENQVQDFNDPEATVPAGFLGVGLLPGDYVRQDAGAVVDEMGTIISHTGQAIVELPSRVPALFGAAFLGEERDQDGPVGIVGASRLGGEILAQEAPLLAELSFFLTLLAAVNISLFLFNLLPIPPLDGGQIFPAIWESIKKHACRLMGRPDPGPVDVAKLLPVALVVAVVFIAWSGILLVADLFNPIRIFG